MTKNAYLFVWTEYGIESIIPITQYEEHEKKNMWAVLEGKETTRNPLDNIINHVRLRALFNAQRSYEAYALDCAEGLTEEDLYESFRQSPQMMADLVREKGVPILENRKRAKVVIQ